jgi:hypothetical protein
MSSEKQSVTIAKMVKLEAEKPIELPEEFLSALSTNEVAKININIGKLSPDFLRKMGSIFIRLGIKTLYSTGLCFTQSACVYEGYIDSDELKEVSIDQIKDELERIEGVSSVEVETLTV